MDHLTAEPALGAESNSTARRRMESLLTGVKEQAYKLKGKSFEDLWSGTVDYVKDNPGKTILVSLATGVVIGSLLRRRGE